MNERYDDHVADYARIQLLVHDKGPLSWVTIGIIIAGVVILILGAVCAYSVFFRSSPAWDMNIQMTTVPVPGSPFPWPNPSDAQVHTLGQDHLPSYTLGQSPVLTSITRRGPPPSYYSREIIVQPQSLGEGPPLACMPGQGSPQTHSLGQGPV